MSLGSKFWQLYSTYLCKKKKKLKLLKNMKCFKSKLSYKFSEKIKWKLNHSIFENFKIQNFQANIKTSEKCFFIRYSCLYQISSTISVTPITQNTAPKEKSHCLMLVTFILQLKKAKQKPPNWNICRPVKYSSCLFKRRRKSQCFIIWDHNYYFSVS